MIESPFPACWRGEDARAIFVTEALEGGDAIFLATHSPVTGFDVDGRDAADIRRRDEEAALEALSDSRRRHAFCVVQGEPGSGKSHLIRWLAVNWPEGKDVKLLLRRADGSLEGALRQLKERLPPEFGSLFDKLGQRHRAAPKGRANIFASTLADTLHPDHFDKPMGDEDWCRANGPADLLGLPAVKQAWDSPGRILRLLEGAGGQRDSETASFNLEDIEALARASATIRPGMVNPRSQDLHRRIQREAETIRAYQAKGWRADELARDASEYFPTSLALLEALNRRRNDAIQNVLGVSSEALKTLFRTVREKLDERGQRLVLLLEDITSWEGLDDSLIDVLVFNADARGDEETPVCPLLSVVGVTPEYYHKLQANYRQRITHEIILGQRTGGLQDVAALRDPDDRRRFAARYLAAVRAGPAALERWREGLTLGESQDPPNICGTCTRRSRCFATFGEEAGIGLFPFTAQAFERLFDSLNENDRGQTWRTPRGILQAILYPNLSEPEALEGRRFPTPLIESRGIRDDRRADAVLSNRLEQIISNRGLPEDEEQRVVRTLAFWGEPSRPDTWLIDGEPAFAGVKRSIFDAFALDWLGDQQPVDPPTPPRREPGSDAEDPAPPLLALDAEEEDTAPSQDRPRLPPGQRPAPPITPPKPKRLNVSRPELEQLQVELRAWAKGGAIANPNRWNRILYELVEKIDSRPLGVPRPLFLRIVTPERVKLEGSTGGLREYLLVEAEPWVRNGLEAYIALKLDKGMSRSDAEFHRLNLGAMLRRLESLAAAYLARRLPRLEDGSFWSPAAAIAQILTARAWLRGTLDPKASLAEHLRTLLSDEPDVQSDPRARSQPWQEWLTATDKLHDKLRGEIRSLVTLGSSDSSGGAAGFIDASEIAGAVERLRQSGRPDAVPATDGGLPDLLKRARELAAHWVERRARIDRTEADQLKNRAQSLHGALRGLGIAAHLARIRAAVEAVARLMPSVAPESVSAWLSLHVRAQQRIAEGRDRPVEGLIAALAPGGDGMPARASERLGWMAAAPARDLQDFLEVANAGERLVDTLYEHVRDCVEEASGAGSLAEVHAAGARLKAASGLSSPVESV